MKTNLDYESLMREAIEQAQMAIDSGNSPFGAVLISHDASTKFTAHNTTRSSCNPTAHAEINVIQKACQKLQTRDLSDFTLVSNAQSCPMCFSAAIKAKISKFVYGYAEDATLRPKITVHQLKEYCDEVISIHTGILKSECKEQINLFRRPLPKK